MLVATMPPCGEKMVMLGGAGVGAALAVAEALCVGDAAAVCVAVGLGAAVPPHAAAMRLETAMSARARLPMVTPFRFLARRVYAAERWARAFSHPAEGKRHGPDASRMRTTPIDASWSAHPVVGVAGTVRTM